MPPLRLEVFEAAGAFEGSTVFTDLSAMEEARLASYEQGYAAGWEDSVAAQCDEKNQLAAELAHNMQCLNFTYHEARNHILRALEPFLVDLASHFLPKIARISLASIVLDALLPIAETAADTPIRILVSPFSRSAIEPLLEHVNGPPLTLFEEATLGEGQVFLQFGEGETRIDLDAAIDEVKAALGDFLTLMTKEPKHG